MKFNRNVRKITTAALLVAIALVIYVIEANIPPLTPVPGIKPGLSNIVTLFALYIMGPGTALSVLVCRVTLGGLATGQPMTIIYSLAGGIPALLFAIPACRMFPRKQIWVVSALSAVIHNMGQITAAVFITSTPELFLYAPVLVASGIITGSFTGAAAQALLFKLTGSGVVTYFKRKTK